MNLKIKIFDFEVFKQDWFVTFLDDKTNEYTTFRNDSLGLIDFIEKNKKDTCFVGYNNNFFDNYCLRCVYNGINPYRIVDWVIKKGNNPWTLPELHKKPKLNFINYDVMTASLTPVSLKEGEGNLGLDIIEMNFDFEYGGKLPEDIYSRLLEYNKHDCYSTQQIFHIEKEEYHAKKCLLEMFGMDYSCMNMSYPKIIAKIFQAEPIPQLESYKYKHPNSVKLKDISIIEQFESHEYFPREKMSFERKIQDIIYTFGLGGGHGALENFVYKLKEDEVMLTADVDSLYPNLMIKYNYLTRCIPNTDGFKKIVDDRLEFKRLGKKAEASAYKNIINPIYGASRQFYKSGENYNPGTLCDWTKGTDVCITGQLFLYMLAEMCNLPTTKHFNLNTDGLYTIVSKAYLSKLQEKLLEWQNITGLHLAIDIIEKGAVIQKDVNNYILYDEKTGKTKTKGKEVKKWQGGSYISNSCSVVDEALVKYFLFDKPINQTIQEAFDKNEVIKFQKIVARKGKNYTATMWGDKEVQKINRVFATFDETKDMLTKIKNGKKNKFSDIPEHCWVDNRDVSKINLKEIKLDLNYYLNLANKKVKSFKGV